MNLSPAEQRRVVTVAKEFGVSLDEVFRQLRDGL